MGLSRLALFTAARLINTVLSQNFSVAHSNQNTPTTKTGKAAWNTGIVHLETRVIRLRHRNEMRYLTANNDQKNDEMNTLTTTPLVGTWYWGKYTHERKHASALFKSLSFFKLRNNEK